MPDLAKLQKFTEAAIVNPLHPVYQLGLSHSPMLQHYHLNVMTLETIKPEQWFNEYPHYTAALTEVMGLCEAKEEEQAAEDEEKKALKAQVADLAAKLAALTPAPVPAAPAAPVAPPAE